MNQNSDVDAPQPDPAGIFACATSLWKSCLDKQSENPNLNLSAEYSGMDELMRVVMDIGEKFEKWACLHIEFDECTGVWPYELEEFFGDTCLKVLPATGLASFDEKDCLRIALLLRLPVKFDRNLPIPISVRAENPISESTFKEFRIQTVRNSVNDDVVIPFCLGDDPWDGELGPTYYAIYAADGQGLLEHIADRPTYEGAATLLRKLLPDIYLPDKPKNGD